MRGKEKRNHREKVLHGETHQKLEVIKTKNKVTRGSAKWQEKYQRFKKGVDGDNNKICTNPFNDFFCH